MIAVDAAKYANRPYGTEFSVAAKNEANILEGAFQVAL
jgi:hypothetical protein